MQETKDIRTLGWDEGECPLVQLLVNCYVILEEMTIFSFEVVTNSQLHQPFQAVLYSFIYSSIHASIHLRIVKHYSAPPQII